MTSEGISQNQCMEPWPWFTSTETGLESIMVNPREKHSLAVKLYRKIPMYKKYLHRFCGIGVEIGIVINKGKLEYGGDACMILG